MPIPAPDVLDAFDRLQELRRAVRSGRHVDRIVLSRADLEGILPTLGITRVGELTGLDQLAIPVWFATRPGSLSLCVSNGKGVTDDDAWISAVMESAEQALAERAAALIEIVDTPRGLARRGHQCVPLDRQSRCAYRSLDPDREMAWVRGVSWGTGAPIYAPYELVGLDMASEAPWNAEHFRMTSVGLASGADLLGAVLHGLRELIEDDAMFAPLAGRMKQATPEVVLLSRRHEALVRTVRILADRGVESLFADVGDEMGEPVMMAALRPTDGSGSEFTYFSGSACRSTREDAALAALLEAVQSRLTFISGARDDLFPDEYEQKLKPGTRTLFGSYHLTDEPVSGLDPCSGLRALTEKVTTQGSDIYIFPLGGSQFGFEAVRVLADDLVSLEAPANHARTGRAARKLLRSWGGK
jgi:ribosomal protein S12 methylthiotransferase accessory factor